MAEGKAAFSDYIVYVDESGDHDLTSIKTEFPVFVLAFCIFHKNDYVSQVVPPVVNLKFRTFGHDMVILHEREIRKKEGHFSMFGKETREIFLEEITGIIERSPFTVIAVVIKKKALCATYEHPLNPYDLAVRFGLERVFKWLERRGQSEKRTFFIFESRGRKEDTDLELEFRRTCSRGNYAGREFNFDMRFADKKSNSTGLQLADLIARPIGLRVFRSEQANRAYEVIEGKLDRGPGGEIFGFGLKLFP